VPRNGRQQVATIIRGSNVIELPDPVERPRWAISDLAAQQVVEVTAQVPPQQGKASRKRGQTHSRQARKAIA